jgi:hypothetical protein
MRRYVQGARRSGPRPSGVAARLGSSGRELGGAQVPLLVGADEPAGRGEDTLAVMRVDPPKSARDGFSAGHAGGYPPREHRAKRRERPIPVRGGDQRSALSRGVAERQILRPPDAGEAQNPSEMERKVRDQLYGPGFRRR